jgi:hypothetical protein
MPIFCLTIAYQALVGVYLLIGVFGVTGWVQRAPNPIHISPGLAEDCGCAL